MSINVTRWTLLVAVIGLLVGGFGVQVILHLNGAEAAVDDAAMGADQSGPSSRSSATTFRRADR